MRMAARIQRVRLKRSMTLEDVETKTGFTRTLMARLEKGREVPTLGMLDVLADALDVPVHVFFYDAAEPELTSRLTPRPTLQELAEECQSPAVFQLSRLADHRRHGGVGSWPRRINAEMKLLVASFFANFR